MPTVKDRCISRLCRELRFSNLEFLMEAVALAPLTDVSSDLLARRLRLPAEEQALDQAGAAFHSLVSRGFVQVQTEQSLAGIRRDIADEGAAMVFDYWALPGFVDFTWAGGILWTGLENAIYGHSSYWVLMDGDEEEGVISYADVVGLELEVVERVLEAEKAALKPIRPIRDIRAPRPIGLWRSLWWRLFRNGYHARIFYW